MRLRFRRAVSAAGPGSGADRLRTLREPGPFRLLFGGQLLSVIGDRMTPVAIAFAVLSIGSATDLGLVFAAGGLPYAVFAIAGGVWADRMGRREVMIASDLARAVSQGLTAALLLSGNAEVWMLAILSAVYGTSAAVFSPALTGLIPQTVPSSRLKEANALMALTRSTANIAGPVLAGVIVAAAGAGEAIALDAATFVVSALCLVRMRLLSHAPEPAVASEEGFVRELRVGWREVRARPWLTWGLGAMCAYHVCVLSAMFVLGPALAEEELNGPSSWAIIIACYGVGSVIGDVCALRLSLPRPVLASALGLLGASTQAASVGSGLGTLGISVLVLFAGVSVAFFFTLWDLSIQEQVPANAVSRVSSYDFALSLGLMPLGMAAAGPISDAVGLHATLIGMSAVSVVAALAWLAVPGVHQVRRPAAALDPDERDVTDRPIVAPL